MYIYDYLFMFFNWMLKVIIFSRNIFDYKVNITLTITTHKLYYLHSGYYPIHLLSLGCVILMCSIVLFLFTGPCIYVHLV